MIYSKICPFYNPIILVHFPALGVQYLKKFDILYQILNIISLHRFVSFFFTLMSFPNLIPNIPLGNEVRYWQITTQFKPIFDKKHLLYLKFSDIPNFALGMSYFSFGNVLFPLYSCRIVPNSQSLYSPRNVLGMSWEHPKSRKLFILHLVYLGYVLEKKSCSARF